MTCHVSLVCALLSLGGCSILLPGPRPRVRPQPVEDRTLAILDDGYVDAAGVIHVHTTDSHDAHGTFEDVVRVANAQGLDYVVLTEHNTLKPLRDGKQGWHGMTLVLAGIELSTRGGHLLAFNVRQEPHRDQPTQAIIDEVTRQGGLAFLAHPYFKKRRWVDWTVRGMTGIEAYNVAHDTLDENLARLVLWTLTASPTSLYLSILDRPYDPLRKWDELLKQQGRLVGIGSADAHEFHLLGMTFAPYEMMFQLARTHVLLQAVPLTAGSVYEALQRGHAYFTMALVADGRGFTFFAEDGATVLGIMGDEIPLVPNLRLTTLMPAPATLVLFKDGRSIATTTGQIWQVPVSEPGIYRLEASRHGKPWIFSNPIYVRPPAPPEILESDQGSADSTQQTAPGAE